jgi:hypothetical protein
VKALDEVAIYACIDDQYGLNEHLRVEKILNLIPKKDWVRDMISPNPMRD